MIDETEEDLAEIKMLADMLLDKEEGEFKIVRRRRLQLDAERRKIQSLADKARTGATIALADMPHLLTYLNALANQLARLSDEAESLITEEQSRKGHLKTALARQIQLDGAGS